MSRHTLSLLLVATTLAACGGATDDLSAEARVVADPATATCACAIDADRGGLLVRAYRPADCLVPLDVAGDPVSLPHCAVWTRPGSERPGRQTP
ncbi:MAG: hypothetical protein NDI82_11620 [Anaeromyxobacteraceae bacterium]|nr:hypothetical protein [Anaeromyxobacteraceae bacterium]